MDGRSGLVSFYLLLGAEKRRKKEHHRKVFLATSKHRLTPRRVTRRSFLLLFLCPLSLSLSFSLSIPLSHFSFVFSSLFSQVPQRCPPSSSSAAWRRPSWAWARGPCGSTPRRRPRSLWPTPVSFLFSSRGEQSAAAAAAAAALACVMKMVAPFAPASAPLSSLRNCRRSVGGALSFLLEARSGREKQWSVSRWDFGNLHHRRSVVVVVDRLTTPPSFPPSIASAHRFCAPLLRSRVHFARPATPLSGFYHSSRVSLRR